MIKDDVILGADVLIFHPSLVNLYGCTIGAGTKIGAFVEIQSGAIIGAQCKISSHSFICDGVEIEDGVEGLVHVSDISWTKRIKHPSEVLKKGQSVQAIITNIDSENRRLSLSIKDLEPNAWDRFFDTHRPGAVVKGKVARFANFGAFVELEEGIEGLCHVSELADERVEKPEDAVQIGQVVSFKILKLDREQRKIGLSARAVGKEDDPGDVLMTREAFEDYRIANRLTVVSNGEDAIAYMRKQGQFADVTTPDLVLLDLNLPRRSGREVLREIKGDPELRRIPVVILTTSESDEDVISAYNLHANAYVRKPVDFEQFVTAVRAIDNFFITVVRLPPR